jgi:hypothetical protein
MTDNSRDVFPLIITASNIVRDTQNSRYRLSFPQPVNFRNSSVAVGSISMYYSWFNVNSTAYNNNQFSVIIPVGAGSTQINITLPNGYFSVADINSFIQQQLIANNIGYLVNPSGDFVYYIELVENPVFYSVQLNCYACPTVLPGSWSNPGAWTLPTTTRTPQLDVPSANNFGRLIGFNSGTFPSPTQLTNYSKISDFVPQISPVQSVVLTCNLLQNKYMSVQNVLYSFTSSGSTFGGLIERAPNFEQWVKVADGDYSSIEIQFLSQDYRPLPIQDVNITVLLLIKL